MEKIFYFYFYSIFFFIVLQKCCAKIPYFIFGFILCIAKFLVNKKIRKEEKKRIRKEENKKKIPRFFFICYSLTSRNARFGFGKIHLFYINEFKLKLKQGIYLCFLIILIKKFLNILMLLCQYFISC